MCRVELLIDVSVIEMEDNFLGLFIELMKLFFFCMILYCILLIIINIINNYEFIGKYI